MTSHYKRSIPMLVQREIQPEIETKEYACLIAFTHGVADQNHFDTLLLTMNLLLVAGQTDKSRKYVIEFVHKEITPALNSLKDKFNSKVKLELKPSELTAIKKLIDFSREFWQKQTGQLYDFCIDQVNLFYKECESKRSQKVS